MALLNVFVLQFESEVITSSWAWPKNNSII